MKYVVDEVALVQVSLPVLWVSHDRVVPPILHARLCLDTFRVKRVSR